MNDHPASLLTAGQTRRAFMKSAAAIGAATWAGRSVGAQTGPATATGGPVPGSLTTPLAPPVPPTGNAGPLAPPDKQPADLQLPPPPAKKVGWAIVGLGELAVGEALPAFKLCEHSRPVALVSGHPDKARRIAAASGVDPQAIYGYENFGRIADNPEIEVVYIVLPNSLHAEYTIKALRAGKHVLCEKPMASTVQECEQMIAAGQQAGRQLGIAYRLHHEPMNRAVMELCGAGEFGKLKLFTSSNCQQTQAPNIRLSASTGGGPVGDVGVYSINAARYCLKEEPVEVMAFANWPREDPQFREVPESVSFLLRFPSGALAQCDCSFGTASSSRYRVLGTKGFIEMDPAFPYRGLRLKVNRQPSKTTPPELAEVRIPEVNQFAKQFDAFSQCARENRPFTTPGQEGLADIRIVLAIHESIRSGRPVRLA